MGTIERLKGWADRFFEATPLQVSSGRKQAPKTTAEQYTLLYGSIASICIAWMTRATSGLKWRVEDNQGNQFTGADPDIARNLNRKRGEIVRTSIRDNSLSGNGFYAVNDDNSLTYLPFNIVTPRADIEDNLNSTLEAIDVNATTGTFSLVNVAGAPPQFVHIKNGISPECPAWGVSPLLGAIPDLGSDIVASETAETIMKNIARIGIALMPDEKDDVLTNSEYNILKTAVREQLSGADSGGELILNRKMRIVSPEMGGLRDIAALPLRHLAESRVCAALGLQPSVVGFMVGLVNTRVGATQGSLLKSSWESGLIPMLNDIGDQLGDAVLPLYGLDPDVYRIRLDVSPVRKNFETTKERCERIVKLVQEGIIDPAKGQEILTTAGDI